MNELEALFEIAAPEHVRDDHGRVKYDVLNPSDDAALVAAVEAALAAAKQGALDTHDEYELSLNPRSVHVGKWDVNHHHGGIDNYAQWELRLSKDVALTSAVRAVFLRRARREMRDMIERERAQALFEIAEVRLQRMLKGLMK